MLTEDTWHLCHWPYCRSMLQSGGERSSFHRGLLHINERLSATLSSPTWEAWARRGWPPPIRTGKVKRCEESHRKSLTESQITFEAFQTTSSKVSSQVCRWHHLQTGFPLWILWTWSLARLMFNQWNKKKQHICPVHACSCDNYHIIKCLNLPTLFTLLLTCDLRSESMPEQKYVCRMTAPACSVVWICLDMFWCPHASWGRFKLSCADVFGTSTSQNASACRFHKKLQEPSSLTLFDIDWYIMLGPLKVRGHVKSDAWTPGSEWTSWTPDCGRGPRGEPLWSPQKVWDTINYNGWIALFQSLICKWSFVQMIFGWICSSLPPGFFSSLSSWHSVHWKNMEKLFDQLPISSILLYLILRFSHMTRFSFSPHLDMTIRLQLLEILTWWNDALHSNDFQRNLLVALFKLFAPQWRYDDRRIWFAVLHTVGDILWEVVMLLTSSNILSNNPSHSFDISLIIFEYFSAWAQLLQLPSLCFARGQSLPQLGQHSCGATQRSRPTGSGAVWSSDAKTLDCKMFWHLYTQWICEILRIYLKSIPLPYVRFNHIDITVHSAEIWSFPWIWNTVRIC